MADALPVKIEPLFLVNGDVDQSKKYLSTCEICEAVQDVVGRASYIDGAQRLGGVWRIYMLDPVARAQVLATGISLRDLQVTLYDKNPLKNPYLLPGNENIVTTRLYVRNVALSYDNGVIINYLKEMNVQMIGELKYCRARNEQGKLTNFKTGDRFVEIVVPDEPLPKRKGMGVFYATLYYKEQKQSVEDKVCGNCKETGHIRRDCPNEIICYACNEPGHKKGSPECQALTMQDTNTMVGEKKQDESSDESSEGDSEASDGEEGEEQAKEADNNGEKLTEEDESEIGMRESEKENGMKDEDESMKDKTIQMKLPAFWAGNTTNSPRTPASSRTASPARVRRLEDISPCENDKEKKHKKKKHGKSK